jgi:proline iminopeptidase
MSQFISRRAALTFGSAAMAAPRAFAAATGQPVTEGRAKVPGGAVWWMKVGAGTKTPLLTLHGGPGAAHNYLLPLKALADERPVVFYDQLGCGNADSPPDEKIYTIQRSVDELDAVRKALSLEKIVLFGHSWGSMLAIEYLCQGRGKGVEKLILGGALASVPQANAGQMRLIAAMPNGDGAKLHALEKAHKETSPEYQKLVDEFYKLHVMRVDPTPDAQASFDALSKSIAYRVMNGPNEFTIVGVIKDWDRRKDLGRIKVPTLIVTGTYDEVTLDCHQTIQKGIKGSKLVILPGCSHMAMVEKPELYVSTLRNWMG